MVLGGSALDVVDDLSALARSPPLNRRRGCRVPAAWRRVRLTEGMTFRDYLRLEGACAVVLGVVLVLESIAFGRWDGPGWVLPGVAVGASALAVVGARAATTSAI